MKIKYKKYLYIFTYALFLVIPACLSSLYYYKILGLDLSICFHPFVFFVVDLIVLLIIMHKLKKEPYLLQIRVINYFKGWNNLILFICAFFGSSNSFIVAIVDVLIHNVLFLVIKIMPVDTDQVDGVEEYFNRYPDKSKHKFYKNTEEIKKEYNPLKKELEVEIPMMTIKSKEEKSQKRKIIYSRVIPILVIVIIIAGLLFSIVEAVKKFNRGNYHHFTAKLNEQEIPIFYEQEYEKTIIPFIYKQYGSNSSYSLNEKKLTDNLVDIEKTDKYILDLQEYICQNGEIDVTCNLSNINAKKEIPLNKSNMKIEYTTYDDNEDLTNVIYDHREDGTVYDDIYIKDITDYITDDGLYLITITNSLDNIENRIKIIINVKESKEMIDN